MLRLTRRAPRIRLCGRGAAQALGPGRGRCLERHPGSEGIAVAAMGVKIIVLGLLVL